ncbi:MAG TPA: HAD family hydrolase [Planctomycetes bacterium]|nr:HAD family hydrolase [Planctomycetota bacterium]
MAEAEGPSESPAEIPAGIPAGIPAEIPAGIPAGTPSETPAENRAETPAESPARPSEPKAILLDRDGVLNRERGFIHGPEELEPREGLLEALRTWKREGFLLLVVSNQSGIARQLFHLDDLRRTHARLQEFCGGLLDAIYICPHHPEEGFAPLLRSCPCRKPGSGMLRQALREWGLRPENCLLLGDAPRDLFAARSLGIKAALMTGDKVPTPDHWPRDQAPLPTFLPDLRSAVAWTLEVLTDPGLKEDA